MRVFLGIAGASAGLVYAGRLPAACWPPGRGRISASVRPRTRSRNGRWGSYGPRGLRSVDASSAHAFQACPAAEAFTGLRTGSRGRPPAPTCWDAVVICPSTTKSLAAIAKGLGDLLIGRVAKVALKVWRSLIHVPHGAPFSAIHLKPRFGLARLGAVILSSNPRLYRQPQSLQDRFDFVVARIRGHLRLPHERMTRWGE